MPQTQSLYGLNSIVNYPSDALPNQGLQQLRGRYPCMSYQLQLQLPMRGRYPCMSYQLQLG